MLSDIDAARNLVALFLKRADEGGDNPFLGVKRGGVWVTISWNEAARQVCLLAESLRGLGLEDGDRVALVSENRPEWCIADLAIMAAGLVTVPAYVTNTERDHLHILDNSGAKAVIVSTEKLSTPLIPAMMRTGIAEHIIPIDSIRQYQSGNIHCHRWATTDRGRCGGSTRGGRAAAGRHRARHHRLHHLHQRHRRRAARGDAAPRRDPVQRGRRGRSADRGFWYFARRTLSCRSCR